MKLLRRTCSIPFAVSLLLLTAGSAQAEPPHAQLRAFAPGGIAIDWEHPDDGADAITLEREAPAFTWTFTALVNSFNDVGLQPDQGYRYKVCAWRAQVPECTPWLAARTLASPVPSSPPAVPIFTNFATASSSITVNWTSSASYSFHQVRWAENGHGDGQNRVGGRSFTANGLQPGTYHFIVQGCNRTTLGSSCSHFSAPLEVTLRLPQPAGPPPQPPAQGIIYGLTLNDDLLWYRHDGRNDGSFRWASGEGKKVGVGWSFKQVFSGGDGIIYAITHDGDLLWYRHDGRNDGSFRWAFGEGKKVGVGWNSFKQVFSGGNGIIYALTNDGDLLWYRHDGRNDGSFRWAFGEGRKVGSGWRFKQVFSGGDGIIYAITDSGDLLWYRHDGRNDGSFRWAFSEGKKVGVGWNVKQVFSAGEGIIYATVDNGDLLWYRHDGRNDGSFRWASGAGKKVGAGWFNFNMRQIFSD